MHTQRLSQIALATLIILQLVMLLSLMAGVPPHPPASIKLFAIAPFIAVAISAAVGAYIAEPVASRTGQILSLLAALCALISFGPQKYVDVQFHLIWPAVIAGQIASAFLIVMAIRALTRKPQH